MMPPASTLAHQNIQQDKPTCQIRRLVNQVQIVVTVAEQTVLDDTSALNQIQDIEPFQTRKATDCHDTSIVSVRQQIAG
jgi:hypothetical protein